MKEEKSEAIVLRSINYKEQERILTLFTQECGLISVIVKRLSARNFRHLALTSPFSQGEFLYLKGNSDLFLFQDGTTLDEHLFLRTKLSYLNCATNMVLAILSSQMPGKSAPALYLLLSAYLKQIPTFEDPALLTLSFYLKLLQHEGLIAAFDRCSICENEPSSLHKGENFCSIHSPYEAMAFSKEEWPFLKELLSTRSFNQLRAIKAPSSLAQKGEKYFKVRIQQN